MFNFQINLADVEYWHKDYETMRHDHEYNEYPPRICLEVKNVLLPISLKGCTCDLDVLDLSTGIIISIEVPKGALITTV